MPNESLRLEADGYAADERTTNNRKVSKPVQVDIGGRFSAVIIENARIALVPGLTEGGDCPITYFRCFLMLIGG